jgi:hypothetical protein
MDCKDCPRFDNDSGRCRDGKMNPLRKETAIQVVQIHGIRAICTFNAFREELIHNRLLTDEAKRINRIKP